MNEIEAVCVLTNVTKKNIKGFIVLKEDNKNNQTKIIVKVSGLKPGKHGFHIHKSGDLRQSCTSLCSHYNPKNKNHGDINDKERHVGDLGNIIADKNGNVSMIIKDKLVKLRGKYSVIGRSIVIHDKEDDLGRGNNKESLKTGNAGKRIACGVIGYSMKNKF